MKPKSEERKRTLSSDMGWSGRRLAAAEAVEVAEEIEDGSMGGGLCDG